MDIHGYIHYDHKLYTRHIFWISPPEKFGNLPGATQAMLLVKSRHADPLLVGFSLTLGGCGEVDAIFQLKNGWFNMV